MIEKIKLKHKHPQPKPEIIKHCLTCGKGIRGYKYHESPSYCSDECADDERLWPSVRIKRVKPSKPMRYPIEDSLCAPSKERGKSKEGSWVGPCYFEYAHSIESANGEWDD